CGAQSARDIGNAVERHGVGAVDRHHHNVEPADRREMTIVELHMQMAKMADAEAGNLEDEYRVAILDHVRAGGVAEIAADIGGDVADEDVADPLRNLRWLSVVTPAMQYMRDALVGKQCVMRG